MIIGSRRVWLAGNFIPARLEISDGKIQRIFSYEGHIDEDFGDERVLPGFIDVHTHGGYGFGANDADAAGLHEWARKTPSEGVTAFMPTTSTMGMDLIISSLKCFNEAVSKEYSGAEMLGIHLEGPFISPKSKGAHPEEFILKPDVGQFKILQNASGGRIKMITLAPEDDDDFNLTRFCAETGVVVSIGHSSATFEQACLSVANGAASMTHVYNAMSVYNHRAPGLVGAALFCEDLFGEIICDCIHVHPVAIANLFRAKGHDHVVVISDSLSAKNCEPGIYHIDDTVVEIRPEGNGYLLDGTLAGSTLCLNEALCNLVTRALVPIGAAINACTINPARLMRIDTRKGKLSTGYDADLVVLRDDYSVTATFCRGRLSFDSRH